MKVQLKIDRRAWRQAERILAGLKGPGVNTAGTQAINRALITMRKVSVQEVRKAYTIKAKSFRDQARIYKASTRLGRLSGVLEIGGQTLPLHKHFSGGHKKPFSSMARRPRRGAAVNVKRSTGRRTIVGGFVAQMKSGHLGVYIRTGQMWSAPLGRSGARTGKGYSKTKWNLRHSRGRPRLPIFDMHGPSPRAMAKSQDVYPRVIRAGNDALYDRFNHEVEYILDRARREN